MTATLNIDEVNLVLGALDSLGVALASHDHVWTVGEREIYEQAVTLLKRLDYSSQVEQLTAQLDQANTRTTYLENQLAALKPKEI